MPDKHAILSASSSHRWLECPPSALLCSTVGDTPSEFAMQGTDAHSLCEHKLKTALGQQSKDPTENLSFFDEEMADCSDMYAQYVMEQLAAAKEKCKDPIVLIEQRLDFSKWVPQGFGNGYRFQIWCRNFGGSRKESTDDVLRTGSLTAFRQHL